MSAARAFFAGAAFLAGTVSPFGAARASDAATDRGSGHAADVAGADDTAMAIPRLAPYGGAPVILLRPLPTGLARLITQAFRDPASPLAALQDSPLIGDILADRYLAPQARPSTEDLRSWLERFPGLPDAPAIHAMLTLRLPRGIAPAAPVLPPFAAAPSGDDMEATDHLIPRNPVLDRTVLDAARSGQFARAIHLVARTRGLSPEYGALLQAEIARAMFSQGQDLQALALAETAARQAPGAIGLAPWIGGLAAWRLGRYDLARLSFEAAWQARLIAPGQRAGAAWWAARANLVTRGEHGPWMRRAAQDPRTFYGLLALHALGQPVRPVIPFATDTLAEADIDAVAATTRGWRAMALLQVQQPARAAAELRLLFTETLDQPGFGRSILLVARTANLLELANQLGAVLQPSAVHFPATRLRPAGGFVLDPALVYALTRLESNFDAEAISPAGARGLMQLMPGTAQFVAAGARTPALHDPATNLDLGQRYLLMLSGLPSVGSDLIRTLAAYNAGPGNFNHWLETMQAEHDPLLFIEALPGDQTRAYIPRALAYTWLYAAQLGLPAPSLEALAAGDWPRIEVRATRRDPFPRLH